MDDTVSIQSEFDTMKQAGTLSSNATMFSENPNDPMFSPPWSLSSASTASDKTFSPKEERARSNSNESKHSVKSIEKLENLMNVILNDASDLANTLPRKKSIKRDLKNNRITSMDRSGLPPVHEHHALNFHRKDSLESIIDVPSHQGYEIRHSEIDPMMHVYADQILDNINKDIGDIYSVPMMHDLNQQIIGDSSVQNQYGYNHVPYLDPRSHDARHPIHRRGSNSSEYRQPTYIDSSRSSLDSQIPDFRQGIYEHLADDLGYMNRQSRAFVPFAPTYLYSESNDYRMNAQIPAPVYYDRVSVVPIPYNQHPYQNRYFQHSPRLSKLETRIPVQAIFADPCFGQHNSSCHTFENEEYRDIQYQRNERSGFRDSGQKEELCVNTPDFHQDPRSISSDEFIISNATESVIKQDEASIDLTNSSTITSFEEIQQSEMSPIQFNPTQELLFPSLKSSKTPTLLQPHPSIGLTTNDSKPAPPPENIYNQEITSKDVMKLVREFTKTSKPSTDSNNDLNSSSSLERSTSLYLMGRNGRDGPRPTINRGVSGITIEIGNTELPIIQSDDFSASVLNSPLIQVFRYICRLI